ncbi:uncharacterized protein LOC112048508 [Bicyclus anynana]|uniref:Uncharacterized protein LOC112048508 n=1 Tax=Bicyclus anynana TaxID=110368 RepID=A0A6J1N1S9_BICAN|nr:uncharacterized protein LOC112048508 [Bicyclus anynana]
MRRSELGLRARLRDQLYTYCAFCIAVSALPALAVSYVVVRISKHLWLKLLSSRYPSLEFIRTDTVRSLLDTHRNQGIINVLLCVKGALDIEEIRNALTQHVVDRRDERGQLTFPRLRHLLVSSWGNYAWDANIQFRLENHFIMANGVYRGRPVSDSNIQDYVSEIISKYFPSDQPPWQYIIIPCVSIEPKYYILVRVHHLLLTGKKSLNIGDFLLIRDTKPNRIYEQTEHIQESPLAKLFPNPSAILELWDKMNENLSNIWNEFIFEYDPTESTHSMKSLPGIFHVAGIVLISAANAMRDVTKKRSETDSQIVKTASVFLAAIQRECKRRKLSVPKVLISPLVTFDPRKWPRKIFEATYSTARMFINLPTCIWDEVIALNELRTTGQVRHVNTLTWKYGDIGQLWVKATVEALRGLIEIYRAPANFWTDTIHADGGKRHILQTVSLSGRKVASWSRPVSRASIERAARALGVSSTDLALFAATESLRLFFQHAESDTPDSILITARAASERFLYTFAEGNGKDYKKSQTGGMVCLSLPVGATPRRIAAVVEDACKRQGLLAAGWAAQARCGALTRSVPSPLARLTMNVLSRKFAVSYAEINAPLDTTERMTLWNKTIDYVVYWRPPQANISMSLTVIQYADTVRLSVMADARLTPMHTVPATRWADVIDNLVNKIDQELARIAAQSQSPLQQIPRITQTDISTEEVEETSQESIMEVSTQQSSLKPPSPVAYSPPPERKHVMEK